MNVRYEKFDVGLYVNLITKKYDFDRVVLFVNFVLCESIDFTGVLWDWWVVNRCVLMCYFFIKYMVFGWVRLKPYFIRVWLDFCVRMVIFGVVKSCKMLDFVGFYRSGYRTQNGGRGVGTSDMPFPTIEYLF